ncbi:MAG: alcohol dehydrogenase catalytic domain-containing protein, partial [Pseudomonadota bacterium]
MRAAVIHAAKDLRIEECDVAALGPREVLVKIEAGGICGSDLHYFHHGGIGAIKVREPMILGHEVAGVVEAVGSNVDTLTAGTRVAVSPSRPCGVCRYCRLGQPN